MSTFKVGDRVRCVGGEHKGLEGTVTETMGDIRGGNTYVMTDGGHRFMELGNNFELLEDKPFGPLPYSTGILERMITLSAGVTYTNTKTNKTLMTSMTSFLKTLTRQEPEKSFVQAGFLDENENITEKGWEALEYILWNANKDSLKALADQVIAEEKK
jgi:hypothetical protein